MRHLSCVVLLLLFLAPAVQLNEKNWWKETTFYQIYPRSFKDSDGDGVGDLAGIASQVDYLQFIGVGAAWLSPVYKSPMKDFGYDITDYKEIDPLFGSLKEFDQLVDKLKSKGMKIIMDFVPNHTSNTSEWFQKSLLREDPYTDYYVWVDGKGPNKDQVPNNWLGMFGGSAWEWREERKQFYYHQFITEQPDLNMRNPNVREELKNVLRFWIKRRVDGFRIDAVKHLFEDPQLRDEPPSNDPTAQPGEYNSLRHIYTTSYPEVFDVVAEWRNVLDEIKDESYRVMMTEINETIANTVKYYGTNDHPLADIPFNFELFKISKTSTVEEIYSYIQGWIEGVPSSKWPNWIIGNHDQPRIANRTNVKLIDAYNMINLLLRGTPLTYYGEEIGMVDTHVTWEETQDPFGLYYGPERYEKFSRDPQRTPMQWNKKKFAGFTHADKSWLPVNPNYKLINVESEKADSRSHLSTYIRLQHIRKTEAARNGKVQFPFVDESILSFSRSKDKTRTNAFVVIINFGDEEKKIDLVSQNTIKDFTFPKYGKVLANSNAIKGDSPLAKVNGLVDFRKIRLPSKQAVVIEFIPKWK